MACGAVRCSPGVFAIQRLHLRFTRPARPMVRGPWRSGRCVAVPPPFGLRSGSETTTVLEGRTLRSAIPRELVAAVIGFAVVVVAAQALTSARLSPLAT